VTGASIQAPKQATTNAEPNVTDRTTCESRPREMRTGARRERIRNDQIYVGGTTPNYSQQQP